MHGLGPFVLDHRAHLIEGNFDALERDDVPRKTPLKAGLRSTIHAYTTSTRLHCGTSLHYVTACGLGMALLRRTRKMASVIREDILACAAAVRPKQGKAGPLHYVMRLTLYAGAGELS
jgi:hypothetical protein